MSGDQLKIVLVRGGVALADANGNVLPGQTRCIVDSGPGSSTVTATFFVSRDQGGHDMDAPREDGPSPGFSEGSSPLPPRESATFWAASCKKIFGDT